MKILFKLTTFSTLSTLLTLFTLLTLNINGQIIHVPTDQPSIQAGIDAATDGDTVLVAQGAYIENINFMGKAITVASNYLIDPDSSHIDNTIIDGSNPIVPELASVVTFVTGEDTTSILCGFTITGGTGMYLANYDAWIGGGIVCYYATAKIIHNKIVNNELNGIDYAWGAGIASINETGGSWTVIEGNTIRNNASNATVVAATGGGIEVWENARICNNIIEDNYCLCATGSSGGGGVVVSSEDNAPAILSFNNNTVNNNTIEANWVYGAGVFIYGIIGQEINHNTISHNTVITNNDYWWGAGIYCEQLKGPVTIKNNEFVDNSGPVAPVGAGGGLCFLDSFDSEITVDANRFFSNTAYHGGGIFERSTYNLRIINNLFVENDTYRGGGIGIFHPQLKEGSVTKGVYLPQIINNTFYANSATNDAGAVRLQCDIITPVIFNCIFWENHAPLGNDIYNWRTGEVNVSYSDIDTDNIRGPWTGDGNINADPKFMDPGLGNYCIDSCDSPCAGSGIDTLFIDENVWYIAPDHDILGRDRPIPNFTQPDMGAYEVDSCNVIPKVPQISNFKFQVSIYPNPSFRISDIRYQISDIRFVVLEVFDINGQKIKTLVNEKQTAGEHFVQFDGSDLPAGIYFVRLRVGSQSESTKLIITH